MSACLFANLSFFICLCASCFSEMAVSKVKMMELSELRSYSFLGSMHIVFHLQFNLPLSGTGEGELTGSSEAAGPGENCTSGPSAC